MYYYKRFVHILEIRFSRLLGWVFCMSGCWSEKKGFLDGGEFVCRSKNGPIVRLLTSRPSSVQVLANLYYRLYTPHDNIYDSGRKNSLWPVMRLFQPLTWKVGPFGSTRYLYIRLANGFPLLFCCPLIA